MSTFNYPILLFISNSYIVFWYEFNKLALGATLAYLIDPKLADNTLYMLIVVMGSYWLLTFITLRGMRASGAISLVTAILGTLLPMAFITLWQFLLFSG